MNAALSHRHAATRRVMRSRASAQRTADTASSTTAERSPKVSTAGTASYVRAAEARSRTRGCLVLTAIMVIAAHGAIVWLAHAWQTHVAARPQPLPMTVTLTSAPRPLPQAAPAAATPQPPQPPQTPQTPQPPRQARPPKPLTPRAAEHHEPPPPLVAAPAAPAAPQAAAPAPSAPQTTRQAAQPTLQPALQPAPATATPTDANRAPQTSAPIGNAAYLHNPAPDYPQIAQDQGWEGRVLLRVHVLADGSPSSVAIQTGSGRRVLDEAAREAVQHWRFVPAKRGDEAVDGWVTVPIDFKLAQ